MTAFCGGFPTSTARPPTRTCARRGRGAARGGAYGATPTSLRLRTLTQRCFAFDSAFAWSFPNSCLELGPGFQRDLTATVIEWSVLKISRAVARAANGGARTSWCPPTMHLRPLSLPRVSGLVPSNNHLLPHRLQFSELEPQELQDVCCGAGTGMEGGLCGVQLTAGRRHDLDPSRVEIQQRQRRRGRQRRRTRGRRPTPRAPHRRLPNGQAAQRRWQRLPCACR